MRNSRPMPATFCRHLRSIQNILRLPKNSKSFRKRMLPISKPYLKQSVASCSSITQEIAFLPVSGGLGNNFYTFLCCKKNRIKKLLLFPLIYDFVVPAVLFASKQAEVQVNNFILLCCKKIASRITSISSNIRFRSPSRFLLAQQSRRRFRLIILYFLSARKSPQEITSISSNIRFCGRPSRFALRQQSRRRFRLIIFYTFLCCKKSLILPS